MKKKTLLGIIAAAVIVPVTICAIVANTNKGGTLLEDNAFRGKAEIDGQTIHYFDEEAVALDDFSGANASLRSEALRAYNLVNEEREAAGLGTLVWDSNLEATSDVRARECADVFSHTRPNGNPWYTVNSDIMGGENLAFGYNNAGEVLDGWMNSPTHRENILYPTFTKISISVYEADDGTLYWAQEFGY
ncbi:MAG: CAP domain-containing protein [Lachnospiraceae bacterium]|nr:CAP domain-containing protein [Lachnospiraceae bacterium]